MSGDFEFSFEELPLLIEGGFEAGLINGSATISYHSDGEWFVGDIFLDGHRERPSAERQQIALATGFLPQRFEQRKVEVDRNSQIYLAIADRLENGKYRDDVAYRVSEELADEGISMRSDFQEHNTHNRAVSGVG